MFNGVGYLMCHLPPSSRSFLKVGNVNEEITTSDIDVTWSKYIREKRIMRER